MKNVALVKNGIVVDRVLVPAGWPNVDDAWTPPADCDAVEANADKGDQYLDGRFWREVEAEREAKVYRVKVEVGKINDEYLTARIAAAGAKPVREVVSRFKANDRLAEIERKLTALEKERTRP